jgi:ankyrin repeat protein
MVAVLVLGVAFTACAKHESVNRSYRKKGNEFQGEKPTTPAGFLQEAIALDDFNKVVEILNADFAVDSLLPNKRTPLVHATRSSKLKIMNELLKRNADREIRDEEGKTALDYALLNAGLDAQGKQLINRAVILLSAEAEAGQRKELMKFAGRGSVPSLETLLKGVGINPNFIDDTGETPLTLAIRNQRVLGVNFLAQWADCPGGEGHSNCLKLTAIDLNLARADGVKPLALAKQISNAAIVEILIRHGAAE